MIVSLNWAVGELGSPARTTLGEVGLSINWAVGELGRPVRISHTITVVEMVVSIIWAVEELGKGDIISYNTKVDKTSFAMEGDIDNK